MSIMNLAIPPGARAAGPDTPPEVLEAITAATVTTFLELTSTDVCLRMPALLSAAPTASDVNATIDLRREPPGRLTCSFPRNVLKSLAERYLPPGTSLTSEILDDTAGEFTNVIAGQAKTMLKGTEYHYTISPPVVKRGPTPMSGPNQCDYLLLIFDTHSGPFSVQFSLLPRHQEDNPTVEATK
jgi:CheY-specific phosphatase CheX